MRWPVLVACLALVAPAQAALPFERTEERADCAHFEPERL